MVDYFIWSPIQEIEQKEARRVADTSSSWAEWPPCDRIVRRLEDAGWIFILVGTIDQIVQIFAFSHKLSLSLVHLPILIDLSITDWGDIVKDSHRDLETYLLRE
jgi:hypothetical protein